MDKDLEDWGSQSWIEGLVVRLDVLCFVELPDLCRNSVRALNDYTRLSLVSCFSHDNNV